MAGRYTWSMLTTKLLILHYESHPMLYNSKHYDYKNRNKRLEIYKNIAEAISEVSQGCTANDVRKKINGLRSQYLAEKMKVLNSKKSGQDANIIYTPSAYWYPLLSFLENSTTVDMPVSNLDNLVAETQSTSSAEFEASQQENENLRPSTSAESLIVAAAPFIVGSPQTSTSRKRKLLTYDELLLESTNTMTQLSNVAKQEPNDSLANFGKFIVSELRDLKDASNDAMLRQTKRKIQQVLMHAWDTIDLAGMTPDMHLSMSSPDENSVPETILCHASNGENKLFYVADMP